MKSIYEYFEYHVEINLNNYVGVLIVYLDCCHFSTKYFKT